MINLYTVCLFGAIVLNLLLGAFVLMTNARRLPNRVFAILSACGACWLGCQLLGATTRSEASLIFWIRQSCAVSALIPLLFYVLRNAELATGGLARVLWQPWPWTIVAVAMAGLCQSQYFIRGARLAVAPMELADPIYGPGFPIFLVYWVVAVVFLVWSFNRALATAKGVSRVELQFMMLGSFLCLVPGVFIVLLVPFWTKDVQTARFTPVAAVLWNSTIAYGIVTRRIMNITEFLGRMLAHVLLIGGLTLGYFAVYRLCEYALPAPADGSKAWPHILAAIAIALSLAPMSAFLQQRADRLFSGRQDRLASMARQVGALAQSVTTVDALLGRFTLLLGETLAPEHVRIYLRDDGHFRLRQQSGVLIGPASWAVEAPLVALLRTADHPMVQDVLRRFGRSLIDAHDERILADANAEAAIPLRNKTGLIGFVLLGRFPAGRTYGAREEDALALLGGQLGIAIENATLYTRLQDASMYNEVLLDNLVTGVIAMNLNGSVTVCNREAQRILGLADANQAINHLAAEILPGAMWDDLRGILASGEGVRDMDIVLRPQQDNERSVRYATAVFRGHGETILGALLVLQDISAIRKLEELIRRNDRMASIGTLAAGMAHEIKNPLVCLKTFAQLLPDHFDDLDFRNTFIPLLGSEVGRIDAIVSQLLNFSRPVKPMLAPMSLHAAIDAAMQLVVQQGKAKALTLDRQFRARRDCLLGDARLLGQVFLNLLLNGIDAMSAGGTLTVSTQELPHAEPAWRMDRPGGGGWIEVRVRDTGCGILPADLPRVFDPFFTTKENGTGLGLSVAHGIIIDHQGLIDVESTPGQGTCFRVLLPLLSAPDIADERLRKA